ncbi:ATP-binding cassette, subfamily C, bacteriocin exporter [Enterococcus sp. DIV0724b]|uniref:ATP-binding cassette domain-containing protein n=1 Tax=Enterococcus sp. DIV0724b TaxID=2774694 RepID=UPI003D2FF34D
MYAHTMQNMVNDCGLATIQTLFKQLKIKNVAMEVEQQVDTIEQGLSLLEIQQILENNGVISEAYQVTNIRELLTQQFPLICVIHRDGLPHYIVVHAIKNNAITFSDPAEPKILIEDIEDFTERFMGYAICVEEIKTIDREKSNGVKELYKEIIGNVKVKDRCELFILTVLKYILPLSVTFFMQYIMIFQMENMTLPYFFASVVFFLTLMGGYYYVNQKDIQLKTALENQFQQKVLFDYYQQKNNNFVEKRNMDNIMGHFWNLLLSVTGILHKLYLKFDSVFIVFLYGILFNINGFLAVMMMFWSVVYMVLVMREAEKIQNFEKALVTSSNSLSSTIEEQVSHSLDIRLFTKDEVAEEKVLDKMSDYFDKKLISYELSARIDSLFELISSCMMLSTFGLFIYSYIFGEDQSMSELILSVFIISIVISKLKPIVQTWLKVQKSEMAVSYIQNNIERSEVDQETKQLGVSKDIEKIELKNISFSYNEDTSVLSNLNLRFRKGHVTGISGGNGSGKTTLTKILLGILEPDSGEVSIDDHSFTSLSHTNIAKYTNAYFPEMSVFKNSIGNNIQFNLNEKMAHSNKMIESYKKRLNFDLPDNHVVFSQGGNLSQGQIQKILLLRALEVEKSIYIFDEPTTNLDKESAKEFLQIIKELSKNKIVILITHDQQLLNQCDEIILLEEGGAA